MNDIKLEQAFGAGATQDITKITIQKNSLPKLTPDVNNTAQQMVVALLLQLHQHFEGILVDENGFFITDEVNNFIVYDNSSFYKKLSCNFQKRLYFEVKGRNYVLYSFIINIFIPSTTTFKSILKLNDLAY
jgi:hypothetical protein